VDGVMPVSLSLSTSRVLGGFLRASLFDVVRPPLDRLADGVEQLNHDLRLISLDVIDVINSLAERRLKVQVMNEALLDNIDAIRWAMAYLSYTTFPQLLDHVAALRSLAGRSLSALRDIADGVFWLDDTVSAFAGQLIPLTSTIVGLLRQILDRLNRGIRLTGAILLIGGSSQHTITIKIDGGGGGGGEPWWKKLAKVGLGLLGIAGFVAALGLALRTFKAGALAAVAAILLLVRGLTPLIELLSKLTLGKLGIVALGFAAIAGFVLALGKAFQSFTTDLSKVVPQLNAFFGSIAKLIGVLAAIKLVDLAGVGLGFAAIAGFVLALGKAFQSFTTDLSKVVPQLNAFFDSISKLIGMLAGMKLVDLAGVGLGFAAIAGFVLGLGKAFQAFTTDLSKIVPQLDAFFDSISKLVRTLAGLTGGDLFGVAFGLAAIAGFVWALSSALGTLTGDAVAAMPALGTLLGALGTLATTLANMSGGEMATMVVGLAAIAGFVWAVAAALDFAAGPLATLEKLFGRLGGALSFVTGLGRGLIGALSDITDFVGGIVDRIGGIVDDIGSVIGRVGTFIDDAASKVGGVISDAAGAATDALGSFFGGIGDFLFGGDSIDAFVHTAAFTPPPPAPAPAIGPAGLGDLTPGGRLAAAAPAGTTTVDQSVNAGGIYVTITAERLEADSARLLTDDIVAQLQARLGALRSTQQFQAGARPAVA
jgi:phage-related protein